MLGSLFSKQNLMVALVSLVTMAVVSRVRPLRDIIAP